MFISYRSFLYHLACSLIITGNLVSSDDIPTILWNIKGSTLHIKSASALGRSDKILIETLKEIHREEANILVFAVNKLSLEDFSASDKPAAMNNTIYNLKSFFDEQPHMLLNSVKDPLNYIHKAHCGVQEIVVDNMIDESIMQSVSSAMERSCVVILHISDDGIVSKKSELKSVFMPSFQNSNKNIVGIFSGVKASWGAPNSERHVFRNLLAVGQADNKNFVNYTGCIIMYAENATIGGVSLPFPVTSLDGSSCDNSSSILQLQFDTSGSYSSVTIKLTFNQTRGSWKTAGTVSMTGDQSGEDIELNTAVIEAAVGFSFSCGDLVIKPKNKTHNFTIQFIGFQVQPFQVKDAFSESFDCVPFFTVPIWMGTFVSLLFIIITTIGVYALFSVHTMDRFDDPKGKTISVAAAGD